MLTYYSTITVHTANSNTSISNASEYFKLHLSYCSQLGLPWEQETNLTPATPFLFTLTADTGILVVPEEDKAQPPSPIWEVRCAGLKTAL